MSRPSWADDYDAARRGDTVALGRLLAAFSPLIVAAAAAWKSLDLVEDADLLEVTTERAIRRFAQQRGGATAFPGWLRRVAQSARVDLLRRSAPELAAARAKERRHLAVERGWQREDDAAAHERGQAPSVDVGAWLELAEPVLRARARRRQVWRWKTPEERVHLALRKLAARDWLAEAADLDRALGQAQRLAELRRLVARARAREDQPTSMMAIRLLVGDFAECRAGCRHTGPCDFHRHGESILENQVATRRRFLDGEGRERWAACAARPLYASTIHELRALLLPPIDDMEGAGRVRRDAALAAIGRAQDELRRRYPGVTFGPGRRGYPMDGRIREELHAHGLSALEINVLRTELHRRGDPLGALLRPRTEANASRARRRV